MVSDAELYAERIAWLVREFSEVPPLWARYPRIHPMDGHWRMGGGEDYKYLFNAWEESRQWTLEERVEYIKRWHPPFSWLEWVAWFLWPEDFVDPAVEVSAARFAQLEAFGFGGEADWRRCFEVDPDDYPVRGDRSSRWLNPERFASMPRWTPSEPTR